MVFSLFFIWFVGTMDLEARVIYVDAQSGAVTPDGSSWFSAYQLLQHGLDNSSFDDEIWVTRHRDHRPTERTNPGDPRTATFLIPDGVRLYGGFDGTEETKEKRSPNVRSVLSGNIGSEATDSDNAYHVVVSADNSFGRLDGFEIKDGRADSTTSTGHSRGGGIFLARSVFQIVNCHLVANESRGEGGAIWASGGMTTIRSSEFRANEASEGGACLLEDTTGVVSMSTFAANQAVHGGALSARALGFLSIDNSIFTLNTADATIGQGGAVRVIGIDNKQSNLMLSNGSMNKNSAYEGGALFIGRNIDFSNTVGTSFRENESTGDGGAIVVFGVLQCLFQHLPATMNHADGSGGTIVIDETHECIFQRFDISDSVAGGGGGAVAVVDTESFQCRGGIFRDNRASGLEGGAFSFDNTAEIEFDNCLLRGNHTVDDRWTGGAVQIANSPGLVNARFADTNFIENHGWGGGAVHSYASLLSFDSCRFIGNEAVVKDGVRVGGGAIWASLGTLEIFGGEFDSNAADDAAGGAIFSGCPKVGISRTPFYRNSARRGGAIYDAPFAPGIGNFFSIYDDCDFLDNGSTEQAGAVYLAGRAWFERCVFNGNASTGGASVLFCEQSRAFLSSCVAAGNTTRGGADAVIVSEAGTSNAGVTSPSLELQNVTVAANSNAPAIRVGAGELTIYNSIIFANPKNPFPDPPDPQISFDPSVTTMFSHSILGGDWPGTEILTVDPKFADINDLPGEDLILGTLDDGLALGFNSPAIDAGSNLFVATGPNNTGAKDVVGKKRIRASGVDMGAYEQAYKDQDLDGFADIAEILANTRLDMPDSHPGFAATIDREREALVFYPKAGEAYQIEHSQDLRTWTPFGDPVSWEDAVIVLPLAGSGPTLEEDYFQVRRIGP